MENFQVFGARACTKKKTKMLQNYFKPSNLNVCLHLHLTFLTLAPIRECSAVSYYWDHLLGGPNGESGTDSILNSVCMWQVSVCELTLKRSSSMKPGRGCMLHVTAQHLPTDLLTPIPAALVPWDNTSIINTTLFFVKPLTWLTGYKSLRFSG